MGWSYFRGSRSELVNSTTTEGVRAVVYGEVNRDLITFHAINGGVIGVHVYGSNRATVRTMEMNTGTVCDSNFGNGAIHLQYSMRRTGV